MAGFRKGYASKRIQAMRRLVEVSILAFSGVEGGALVALDLYAAFCSKSNHTGLPLGALAGFGLGGAALGGALALLGQPLVRRRTAAVMCLVSALLAFNIYLLDRANLLMEYESWARKGMPL